MNILLIFLVFLDQASKLLFLLLFERFPDTIVIVRNTGIAFGIFQNSILIIAILNIFLLLGLLLYRHFSRKKLTQLGFTFIVAGGIANLFDRIFRGFVVDFIQLPFIPVFNIADMCINIGIGIILYSWIKNDLTKGKQDQ